MSTEIVAPDEIKNFIQDIIKKYDLDSNSKVNYNIGSEIGDGYQSKTITADILDKSETINLFIKYGFDLPSFEGMPVEEIHKNEAYFFDVVYTEFLEFAKSKGIEEALTYVPKCYGTSPNRIVALENLKSKGYQMFDRKKPMNDDHILEILKLYAEFHAISLAMNDQNKEEFKKLTARVMKPINQNEMVVQMLAGIIHVFVSKLDPVDDKLLFSRGDTLFKKILEYLGGVSCNTDEYSVITKGDCWVNNMMFLYKDENKDIPSKIMLIDYQAMRYGSIVLDIAYLLYTTANKEQLSKLNFFLKEYHQELSKNIQKFGSDPEVVYPYSVLEKEWKEHCLYGYFLAFFIVKLMLVEKEDVANLQNLDFTSKSLSPDAFKLQSEVEYINRMKILSEHLIENNFI